MNQTLRLSLGFVACLSTGAVARGGVLLTYEGAVGVDDPQTTAVA